MITVRSNGCLAYFNLTIGIYFTTGGIDLYDRTFSSNPTHDRFYTQSNIISTFKNYVKHVVLRYANDPTIFAWELGNDLRCASTLPASSKCNPQTITSWANDLCA